MCDTNHMCQNFAPASFGEETCLQLLVFVMEWLGGTHVTLVHKLYSLCPAAEPLTVVSYSWYIYSEHDVAVSI